VTLDDPGDQRGVGESQCLERLGVLEVSACHKLASNISLTGVGTSAPVILSGGASRKSNAEDSQIWAMISDPTPNAEETLVSCHSEQHNKRTWESTLNSNQVVGLLDRGDDSLNVERTDRSMRVS
jgi:hypothetical protein